MVEYLNIDQIIEKYGSNHFYIAHFYDSPQKCDSPSSDKKPYRACLKWASYELNPIITIVSANSEQKTRNQYFKYIVSDSLEELEKEYKFKKQLWINKRRAYLNSELQKLKEIENEL